MTVCNSEKLGPSLVGWDKADFGRRPTISGPSTAHSWWAAHRCCELVPPYDMELTTQGVR